MNILLLQPEQLTDGKAVLRGAEARRVFESLDPKVGDLCRVGLLDGPLGLARVLRRDEDELELEVSFEERRVDVPVADVIIAITRPQMLKRILECSPTIGIGQLMIVQTERAQKSYFQSHVTEPDAIRERLTLGMEQGMTTRMPEVHCFQQFRDFVASFERLVGPQNSTRLLAHPFADKSLTEVVRAGHGMARPVIAIGPEAGWSEREVSTFRKLRFEPFSFGQRILRVETAVTYAIAQLAQLNEQRLADVRSRGEQAERAGFPGLLQTH